MKKISKNTTNKSEMNQAGYSHVLSKFLHARNGKHHQEQSRRAALAAAFGHHKGQEASHSQRKAQIQQFSMTAKVSDSNPERLFINVYDTTAYNCLHHPETTALHLTWNLPHVLDPAQDFPIQGTSEWLFGLPSGGSAVESAVRCSPPHGSPVEQRDQRGSAVAHVEEKVKHGQTTGLSNLGVKWC